MARRWLALAALLVPCTAQAQVSPAPPPVVLAQRATLAFAEIVLPIPDGQATEPVLALTMDAQGVVRLGDRALTPLLLNAALDEVDTTPARDTVPRLTFAVAGDLPVVTVLPVLQRLDRANVGYVDLPGMEAFSRFGPTDDLPPAPANGPAFIGPAARYEYAEFIDAGGDAGDCRAIGSGQVLGALYLYDHAFTTLDGWVQTAGGPERIVATWDRYPVFATIQSPPHTPWRCLGGAIYHLQRAGYPTVRIELVPEH